MGGTGKRGTGVGDGTTSAGVGGRAGPSFGAGLARALSSAPCPAPKFISCHRRSRRCEGRSRRRRRSVARRRADSIEGFVTRSELFFSFYRSSVRMCRVFATIPLSLSLYPYPFIPISLSLSLYPYPFIPI